VQERETASSGETLIWFMQNAKDRLASRKRKKLWRMLLVFLSAVMIFSVLFLRIRLSARAVELAYEIENLAKEKRSLGEENRKLTLEVARLKSPERISRIATNELNMVRSADAEVVTLKR